MAAMVGLGMSQIRPLVARWLSRCTWMRASREDPRAPPPAGTFRSAMAFTSPPEQKAPPAPVSTTTPTSSSTSTVARPRARPSSIWEVSAFRRSGRFKVNVATPSSISIRSSSVPTSSCLMVPTAPSGPVAPSDAEREALVVVRRDLVALRSIGVDTADVGHEHARLALDVGPDVPGVPLGEQGEVGQRGDECHPVVLGLRRGLDAPEAGRAQVDEAVGDPVHVLLDGDDHVGEDRGAAGSGDEEQVGEAGRGQTQIATRAVAPLVGERLVVLAADVNAGE